MAVTIQQIDVWRTAPSETQTLEFKEAKNQYDTHKLFSYCVAIANEGGGFMLLGIKNKYDPNCVFYANKAVGSDQWAAEELPSGRLYRV